MPKSVSDDFLAAFARPFRKVTWSVEYRRRYWNGSAYVLEDTAHVLTPEHILSVSPIVINLEEANGGEILTSSCTVYVRNSWRSHRWLVTNRIDSVWAPDATATLGYEPRKSEFAIKYGYLTASGDFETVALFTGYADRPRYNSDMGAVEIRLTGGEVLLQGKSAHDVSNAFTAQPASGTVDGINDTFDTDYSVWDISAVEYAGTTYTQGIHYDVQNTNDHENKAQIVFRPGYIPAVTSPASTVNWTGRQWKRGQSISTLVGLLCDLAGIGSSSRTIEEPEWPAAAIEFHVDTLDEMESQSLVDIDARTEQGAMRGFLLDGFDDNELSSPYWYFYPGASGYSASGGKLVSSSPSGQIALLLSTTGSSRTYLYDGSAQVWCKLLSGQVTLWPWRRNTYLLGGGGGRQGVGFRVTASALQIVEEVDNVVSVIGTAAFTPSSSGDLFQISLSTGGAVEVRSGATTVTATSTHTTPPSNGEMLLECTGSSELDDLAFTSETDLDNAFSVTHATAETAEEDLTAAPSSWGVFEADVSGDDGTVTFVLRVSDTQGGPYTDTVVTPGAVPTAPLKRFAKVLTKFLMDAGGRATPSVSRIKVNASLTSLTLAHADFSGSSAWQAIKELGAGPGMDVFFGPDGHFYFLNKSDVSTPDFVLDENNAIQGIDNLDTGEEDVRNLIQVRHGAYYAEWNSTLAGEDSPTSQEKHDDRILSIDLTKFPFSAAVTFNVTQSIAQLRYDQKSVARRLVTARSRIIPHMNPLDVATVSFRHTPLLKDVIFGDELQVRPSMGNDESGPSNVLLQRMTGRVVGISMDVMRKTQKTTYLEVLS